MAGLGLKTFLSAVEMVQQALRMKREDFWSPQVCKLKYVSFTSEFPEVNEAQFFWACEQWIQSSGTKDFPRFPTWNQLMGALYNTENGAANRSWGFKRDLPQYLSPTPEQQAMLPATAVSIAGAADPKNAAAYDRYISPHAPMLPSVTAATGDGDAREWAEYLHSLADRADAKAG